VSVAIAGVGLHPFGRFDAGLTELGVAAVRAAMLEAGIRDRSGFQAAFCGTAYGGVAAGHKILGALGLTGGPIIDVEAGCASGAAALQLGAAAIEAGLHDTVLVLGVEKMPRGMIRSTFFDPWMEQAGLAATPAYFALRAQRLMRESGVTVGQLAEVVVKNRAHGARNPDAMYRTEVTVDEVLASRLVCDPLRLWMLCTPNEGAAAVVLRRSGHVGASEIRLDATVLRSHLPGNVLGEDTPLAGVVDDAAIPTPTQRAARDAYEAAGIGPEDVDLAEVQDTDAARELLAYEELGFCGRGEAGAWFAAGHSQAGGRLPVNVSGGLLSKGEPLGASALGHVVELVRQLRGEAGDRQVASARVAGSGAGSRPRVALAHNVGRGANASVTILTR
jgi:acetyl-CoA acetyltransferase